LLFGQLPSQPLVSISEAPDMSDEPVKIGILGAARVAVYAMIAPARAEPRARLVAVAARDPVRGATYAKQHDIPRVHESYDALLADREIELVYIATPPSLHAKWALATIAAGKHVLVEKPFAMNEAEALAVAQAAEARGVKVFEAMHSRHHRLFARILEIVRSGELGDIVHASGQFEAPIPREPTEFRWHGELGGGALMDLGVYPLSWLRGVFAAEPQVKSARAKVENGVDAEIEAELTFLEDRSATMRASMISSRFVAALNLKGTTGELIANNPLAPQMGHLLTVSAKGATRDEKVEGPPTFSAQLTAVCASIRDGAAFPLSERDYVRSMAAIDGVRRAAGM
jgi:predicted dehydrogenase